MNFLDKFFAKRKNSFKDNNLIISSSLKDFVRDEEEGKLEQEEKTYIYRLFKSGKLKLMNDEDNPTMEPTEYFDEYFFIKD